MEKYRDTEKKNASSFNLQRKNVKHRASNIVAPTVRWWGQASQSTGPHHMKVE